MKINMLMGGATAATQIEGGDTNNNWYRFSQKNAINDGTSSIRAIDHYRRFKEDIDIMAKLNFEIYRMSIEWSRIEPKPGQINYDALDHYRQELQYLKSKKIKTLVTLHHFSNPLWFEDMGGFTNKLSIKIFKSYCTLIIKELGDLINDYITFNEPNVYVYQSFINGYWPPCKKNYHKAFLVLQNMSKAHKICYELIHANNPQAKVSIANNIRIFDPKNPNSFIDKLGAKVYKGLYNDYTTDLFYYEGENKFYDFVGINYYTRSAISAFRNSDFENVEKNDLNWEIYPKGLRRITRDFYDKYQKEIWITENGICDNDDTKRIKYIKDHLKEIAELDFVTRYYHWSAFDNFEWREGEEMRFGLVHIDYESGKRKIKESGYYYAGLIKVKEL